MRSKGANFTKIDMSGVNAGSANCGILLCENENGNDNQVLLFDQEKHFVDVQNLKVSFRDFFDVMAKKLKESKRMKENVIFEDN
jgi:hypothetical protein